MARRAAVLAQLGETPAAIRLPSGLWVALAALVGGGAGAGILVLAWRPLLGRLERSLGIASALPLPPLALAEIAVGLLVMLAAGCALGYYATPLPAPSDHA
jgi:cell division protein FtsX